MISPKDKEKLTQDFIKFLRHRKVLRWEVAKEEIADYWLSVIDKINEGKMERITALNKIGAITNGDIYFQGGYNHALTDAVALLKE